MKKRIGIMGGTFNPIHFGHLLLAERAYEEYNLQEVLFMPSKKPSYKNLKELASENDRKRMVELAIEQKSYFSVSTLEYERTGNTYTYETMKILHNKYPQYQYYFLIGADSLFQLEQWKYVKELLKSTSFLVATRDGASYESLEKQIDILHEKYCADIHLLHMPTIEISSTEIRKRRAEKKSISYLVPKNVETFILQQDLYTTERTE